MSSDKDIPVPETGSGGSEAFQTELDKRIFHLKTLYDVSKDILGRVEIETILKNFLLMITGNFGVMEGFLLTQDAPSSRISSFTCVGLGDQERTNLTNCSKKIFSEWDTRTSVLDRKTDNCVAVFPQTISGVVPFKVDEDCLGCLGLGSKIVGTPYSEDDKELLITLVNNLAVAIRNARSFENIKRLNLDLQQKNIQLEKALHERQAALKKIELLESIKTNLCKFVPTTVTKMIERSPTDPIPDAKDQDVSVLFLDIAGYTKLSERIENSRLNDIIQKYFSVFMESIYENNGDVNETAGDGLMVIFLNEDERSNALDAMRAALTIRQKASLLHREDDLYPEPLKINMGINSGRVLLGAAKFESYTGSRWTYTARGMVTNVAARITQIAAGGHILLTKSTADRIKDLYLVQHVGTYSLKNISQEIELYSLEGRRQEAGRE